jgi:hypothetical protein
MYVFHRNARQYRRSFLRRRFNTRRMPFGSILTRATVGTKLTADADTSPTGVCSRIWLRPARRLSFGPFVFARIAQLLDNTPRVFLMPGHPKVEEVRDDEVGEDDPGDDERPDA